MPLTFNTYPGTVDTTIHDRVPALRFTPGTNGYGRYVTDETFIPPVQVAGWMQLRRWSGPRSPGNAQLDGLHVHLGHIGNARNYVASMVRRDGHAKLAVEYGWSGYHTVRWQNDGPELVTDRVYLFDVRWLPDRIETTVSSEAGVWEMVGDIPPERRIPQGSVGFRLDNLVGVGGLTVRNL